MGTASVRSRPPAVCCCRLLREKEGEFEQGGKEGFKDRHMSESRDLWGDKRSFQGVRMCCRR